MELIDGIESCLLLPRGSLAFSVELSTPLRMQIHWRPIGRKNPYYHGPVDLANLEKSLADVLKDNRIWIDDKQRVYAFAFPLATALLRTAKELNEYTPCNP